MGRQNMPRYDRCSRRSTQEGDWPLAAFSPHKQNLKLYFMSGFDEINAAILDLEGPLSEHPVASAAAFRNPVMPVNDIASAQQLRMRRRCVLKRGQRKVLVLRGRVRPHVTQWLCHPGLHHLAGPVAPLQCRVMLTSGWVESRQPGEL